MNYIILKYIKYNNYFKDEEVTIIFFLIQLAV